MLDFVVPDILLLDGETEKRLHTSDCIKRTSSFAVTRRVEVVMV
jgi:hypothetical protein